MVIQLESDHAERGDLDDEDLDSRFHSRFGQIRKRLCVLIAYLGNQYSITSGMIYEPA